MKTALVTGGTRGIGFGIAGCLARDGYNLVLGYGSNAEAAARARASLEEAHRVQVVCVGGDVAAKDTMDRLFGAVHEHFGGELQAFIHNAGLYVGLTSEAALQPSLADEDFEPLWEYYQRVYPRAFKRGLNLAQSCKGLRHVVAVSSPGCNATQPPQVAYEAPGQAKSSMEVLVRIHARLLAKAGINVNCVIPGFIRTEAWEKVLEKTDFTREGVEAWMQQATPAQRWAEPSEIGEAVAFLCSERASFITGVALPVDGGLHLKG